MKTNIKHWILFWAAVILILGLFLAVMVCVVEKVEKLSSTWEEQIEQKQTQELDSIRISEEEQNE